MTGRVGVLIGVQRLAVAVHGHRLAITVHRVGAVRIQVITEAVPDNVGAFTQVEDVVQAAQ